MTPVGAYELLQACGKLEKYFFAKFTDIFMSLVVMKHDNMPPSLTKLDGKLYSHL